MSLQSAWYQGAAWLKCLRPFSSLFRRLVLKRCAQQRNKDRAAAGIPVPVVIVGNISIGGTGKTPLVIALIELLRAAGYRPGVVSRGYGAKPPAFPWQVTTDTRPCEGGDEPCLIVQRTRVPLVIDPDRPRAVEALLAAHDCDLIISDDGLQHYALARDLEIVVIDGKRGLGNGRCLPEGPLREPPERLALADWVVVNGGGREVLPDAAPEPVTMMLEPGKLIPLTGGQGVDSGQWSQGRRVHALAGIGHPQRFFDTLRALGFDPVEHPLADHADIKPEMLRPEPPLPVIMTEKDAVKCSAFPAEGCWALRVDAHLSEHFQQQFLQRLAQLSAPHTGQQNGS